MAWSTPEQKRQQHPNRRGVVELALIAAGMNPERPELAHYGAGLGGAIRTAIEDGVPTLVRLLADNDPAVRLGSARLLGYAQPRGDESIPSLLSLLATESDEVVLPWVAVAAYQLSLGPQCTNLSLIKPLMRRRSRSSWGPRWTAKNRTKGEPFPSENLVREYVAQRGRSTR